MCRLWQLLIGLVAGNFKTGSVFSFRYLQQVVFVVGQKKINYQERKKKRNKKQVLNQKFLTRQIPKQNLEQENQNLKKKIILSVRCGIDNLKIFRFCVESITTCQTAPHEFFCVSCSESKSVQRVPFRISKKIETC